MACVRRHEDPRHVNWLSPACALAPVLRAPINNTYPMTETSQPSARSPKSLSGLIPFLRPYRLRIGLALVFLVLAAASTLAFPLALRSLIDGGLTQANPGERMLAMRGHFAVLFGVAMLMSIRGI